MAADEPDDNALTRRIAAPSSAPSCGQGAPPAGSHRPLILSPAVWWPAVAAPTIAAGRGS